MMQRIIVQALNEPLYSSIDAIEHDLLLSQQVLNKDTLMGCALKSQTIGQSFAIAYRCALQVLLPSLDSSKWAALCVTEKAGNHPKQITTSLAHSGKLSGVKSFVSMADRATQFIVIAKRVDTPHDLKAVLVSAGQSGVMVNVFPAMSFIPEVGHGELLLTDTEGIELEGDGHNDYSRVFRFLEDSHVLLAFSCLMLSHSLRHELPFELVQRLLRFVHSCRLLTHEEGAVGDLLLAELFADFERLIMMFERNFKQLPNDFVQQWLRDKKIFSLATKARSARTEKAQAELLSAFTV